MRTLARKIAFQTIFADLFASDNYETVLNQLLDEEKLDAKGTEFAKQILLAYKDNKAQIVAEVESKVEGYELQRVYRVDLALIYLGITEIKFIGTPKAVVINEILEIAKTFSSEKSVSFINGVFAKLN